VVIGDVNKVVAEFLVARGDGFGRTIAVEAVVSMSVGIAPVPNRRSRLAFDGACLALGRGHEGGQKKEERYCGQAQYESCRSNTAGNIHKAENSNAKN